MMVYIGQSTAVELVPHLVRLVFLTDLCFLLRYHRRRQVLRRGVFVPGGEYVT